MALGECFYLPLIIFLCCYGNSGRTLNVVKLINNGKQLQQQRLPVQPQQHYILMQNIILGKILPGFAVEVAS